MHLIDRHPRADAGQLVTRFVPPHRFEDVRFATYRADPSQPSQAAALQAMSAFAAEAATAPPRRRFWSRPATPAGRPARYLDGGFGVGKTHLLASLWHAVDAPHKAYLSFEELTAFIGFSGMGAATASFAHHRLLCIDEFELDDVANTLMVVSFLRAVMGKGMRLAVTSNTLPDQLGERRFSASEFRREIAAIAEYFDELRIDGPDFRRTSSTLPLAALEADGADDRVTDDRFPELLTHLRRVHPVQYGPMLDGLHGVRIEGLHPIHDQDQALLFVQFVDKLYDARIPVSITGCAVNELFAPDFREGGYRKKYGRAESRLAAMQAESVGLL